MVDRRREGRPEKDEWRTPPRVVRALARALDLHFTLDPCTTPDNPLGMRVFYTKAEDGLTQPWKGAVFVNPPFSQKDRWLTKAMHEAENGATVGVLLESQTDTALFHETLTAHAMIYLLRPRIRFLNEKNEVIGDPMRGHLFAVFTTTDWRFMRPYEIKALDLRPFMGHHSNEEIGGHAREY